MLKNRREDVLKVLKEVPVECETTPYASSGIRLQKKIALQNMPLFKEGGVEVQDEGSQLLAQIVGAKRGEMVVDFCAGAGGKTLALGVAMRNTGRLYAFDVSDKRLAKMKPRLARSGLSNVHPVQIAHERDARIKVYATCSLLEDENEKIVSGFLEKDDRFVLLPMKKVLEEGKVDLDTGDFLKLLPHRHQTDGFFAAVLERVK